MLPKIPDVWELKLPNDVELIATIKVCRYKLNGVVYVPHLYRSYVRIRSTEVFVKSFGMPPSYKSLDAAVEDARRILLSLGFQKRGDN